MMVSVHSDLLIVDMMNDPIQSASFTDDQPSHNWNAQQIHQELRKAAVELKDRGLKVAAKFVTEQLVGIDMRQVTHTSAKASSEDVEEDFVSPRTPPKQRSKDKLFGDLPIPSCHNLEMPTNRGVTDDTDKLLFAQVLFDSGEFERSASILSEAGFSDGRCTGRPLKVLSSKGIFLRGYALYLAGEKRKEEDALDVR